jgi:hypothetical protein
MSRVLLVASVVLVLMVASARSAPLKGAWARDDFRVEAQSRKVFEERFQGGRRACVIIKGDQKPSAEVGIAVFDESNQLVAQDRGADFAGVIWYPPRDAKYKVEVKNDGPDYNLMYIVLK